MCNGKNKEASKDSHADSFLTVDIIVRAFHLFLSHGDFQDICTQLPVAGNEGHLCMESTPWTSGYQFPVTGEEI